QTKGSLPAPAPVAALLCFESTMGSGWQGQEFQFQDSTMKPIPGQVGHTRPRMFDPCKREEPVNWPNPTEAWTSPFLQTNYCAENATADPEMKELHRDQTEEQQTTTGNAFQLREQTCAVVPEF